MASAAPSPTLRILLIEDSVDDAELLAIEVAEAGLDADWTRVDSETELLAAVAAGPYDLVVSDIGLPGFSGARARSLVREVAPDLPFVFLSGEPGTGVPDTSAKTDHAVSKFDLDRMPALILRLVRLNGGLHSRTCTSR